MLLRSEEFQTEGGVRMIREFYGERGSEGEEIITATHERPADAELVVDNIAKETTLTAVKTAVGTNEDVAGTATLFGQIKTISENSSGGVVKSIQRGVVTFNNTNNKTIQIATIDPTKSFVILQGEFDAGTTTRSTGNSFYMAGYVNHSSILSSITANSIVITPHYVTCIDTDDSYYSVSTRYGKVSYQVIELY